MELAVKIIFRNIEIIIGAIIVTILAISSINLNTSSTQTSSSGQPINNINLSTVSPEPAQGSYYNYYGN